MINRKRFLKNFYKLSALLLAVLLIFLVGCGDKKKVKLRVWQTETDKAAVEKLNEIAKIFKAKMEKEQRGLEIEVQIESIPWNSLSQKLKIAIESGDEPDIAHIEPFMFGSMISKDLLEPLDDVVGEIEKANNDRIIGSVRELQFYNGKIYGIAYAMGVTGYAFRKDKMDEYKLNEPSTWEDFVDFTREMCERSGKKIILPGGDPFFIDQLAAELLANNGGRLFDPVTYKPLLDDTLFIQTLKFLKDISPYVEKGWENQGYLDQFNKFARAEVIIVPVTYVRAIKSIENIYLKDEGDKSLKPDPRIFSLMIQPRGPNMKGKSISTIDCEPFVVFRKAGKRNEGFSTNAYYAKEFLKIFYEKDNYLSFVNTVPIHLTPIFENMSRDSIYRNNPLLIKWKSWSDIADSLMYDTSRVRPILMPDVSDRALDLPFLLEFQSERILSDAVYRVMSSKNISLEDVAKEAQQRALFLLKRLGYIQGD